MPILADAAPPYVVKLPASTRRTTLHQRIGWPGAGPPHWTSSSLETKPWPRTIPGGDREHGSDEHLTPWAWTDQSHAATGLPKTVGIWDVTKTHGDQERTKTGKRSSLMGSFGEPHVRHNCTNSSSMYTTRHPNPCRWQRQGACRFLSCGHSGIYGNRALRFCGGV